MKPFQEWLALAYPTPADALMSEEEALLHSHRKWFWLQPENREGRLP